MLSHQRHISDKTGSVLCHRPGAIILLRAAAFVGCKTRPKLSSVTLVRSQQHVLSLPWPCAISLEDCKCTHPIKAEPDSLVTKSMQICPPTWEAAAPGWCEQSDVFPAFTVIFLPLCSLNVIQQPFIEVLSESSKWLVTATALDHRQVFVFHILYCFCRDGRIL